MKTTNDNAENTISIKESDFNTVDGKKFELDSKFNSYKGQVEMHLPNGSIYKGHLENSEFNGHGELTYARGSIYKGEFKDGQSDGQGEYTYDDGSVYKGEFKEGQFNGLGELTNDDGSVYKGGFKNDEFDGYGEYMYDDESAYKGEFKEGQFNGHGEYTYEDGSVYKGEFKDDMRNGQGALTYANGNVYEGEFKDDMRNGQGELTYEDESVYKGEFIDDSPTEKGELTYEDGAIYKGEYMDDVPHGKGELTYTNGDIYKGEFMDNLPNGQGILTFVNGNVYEGEFKDDLPDGQGILTYVNGNAYDGEFKDGMRNGKGKFFSSYSFVYDGEFKDNICHGQGKISYDNEVIYNGEFKNGSPYLPELNKTKKNQTILFISDSERSSFNSHFKSLSERYEDVISLDEASTMNADLLKKSISNATKVKNKKLKVVIGTHGNRKGRLTKQSFILETLKKALVEIKEYNNVNVEKPLRNVDIVLNACYGSKAVENNEELKNVFKSFVIAGIDVNVSSGDEKFAGSSIIINNKNLLSIKKTGGYYIINHYRFNKETNFNSIKPYRVKKYKTVIDFLKDNYLGKNKEMSNDILNPFKKPNKFLMTNKTNLIPFLLLIYSIIRIFLYGKTNRSRN